MTSKARPQPPATRSSNDPKDDVWIRQRDPKKRWQHRKGTITNVILRSRSRVTKRHTWRKGWPLPEGIYRRSGGNAPVPSKRLKPPYTSGPEKWNPTRRRRTNPARRRDSHRDYRRPKNTAPTWGRGPQHEGQEPNPPEGGKASLRSRTEEEHTPDLRQVAPSWRPRTPQDRGTQRHRGPTRASRQASDRKTG